MHLLYPENMKNEAYDKAVNQMKEVAAGRRGWVSLTRASRECGVPKGQLRVVALALGLSVEDSHGNHGMTARRGEGR